MKDVLLIGVGWALGAVSRYAFYRHAGNDKNSWGALGAISRYAFSLAIKKARAVYVATVLPTEISATVTKGLCYERYLRCLFTGTFVSNR